MEDRFLIWNSGLTLSVRHYKKVDMYRPCTIVRVVKSCSLQGTGYKARTRTGSIEDFI